MTAGRRRALALSILYAPIVIGVIVLVSTQSLRDFVVAAGASVLAITLSLYTLALFGKAQQRTRARGAPLEMTRR